jgi:hypothetical protein
MFIGPLIRKLEGFSNLLIDYIVVICDESYIVIIKSVTVHEKKLKPRCEVA